MLSEMPCSAKKINSKIVIFQRSDFSLRCFYEYNIFCGKT